jgi:hypothetical protein
MNISEIKTEKKDDFELYPDPTIILELPPDDPEEDLTEAEEIIKLKKIKALKCKVIALNELDMHPINTNVSLLPLKKKKKLLKLVEDYFDKDIDEIDKIFNEIVNDEVLNNEADYTTYPIYKKTYKISSVLL